MGISGEEKGKMGIWGEMDPKIGCKMGILGEEKGKMMILGEKDPKMGENWGFWVKLPQKW